VLVIAHKKLRRLYRETGCRCADAVAASGRSARAPRSFSRTGRTALELDFASDAFSDGRRFPIMAIVNDVTRECRALIGSCDAL
jgi:putative transposase